MKYVYSSDSRMIDRVRDSIKSMNKENPKNPAVSFVTCDPVLTIIFKDGSKTKLDMSELPSHWHETIAHKMQIE